MVLPSQSNKPFKDERFALALAIRLAVRAKEKYGEPFRKSLGTILRWINACQRNGVIIENWNDSPGQRMYVLGKKKGLCANCGKRPAEKGVLCIECIRKRKEKRQKRIKNN